MPSQESKTTGLDRFTDNARKAIVSAHDLATKYTDLEVKAIHVFLSILQNPTPLLQRVFDQLNIDVPKTQELIAVEANKMAEGMNAKAQEPQFSEQLKHVINNSFAIAQKMSHVYVGTEHLLISCLHLSDERYVQDLKKAGITAEEVEKVVSSLGNYWPGVLSQPEGQKQQFTESNQISKLAGEDNIPTDSLSSDEEEDGDGDSLPFFCKNMNEKAKQNEFLPITGRDKEVERLIHILSRKTKNNPILVGDAGVGKTAIVEGLVQRIEQGNISPSFMNKQILSLDLAAVMAGARIRGDMEDRILSLVNELIESDDKILFIDEIHMIVGAGSMGGRDGMDVANILKPYLTDPRMRVIGATTLDEYRRFFDDDAALSRRFQPINVEEISQESALEILKNLRGEFEQYHNVRIVPSALQAAVDLSSKFIIDRYLPDKAIDLIDEAAASVKIGAEIEIEPTLTGLGDKLVKVQEQKQKAIQESKLEAAAKAKNKEDKIVTEIADLIEGRHEKSVKQKTVTEDLIKQVVVSWTKIPLAAASIDNEKLKNLQKRIRQRIAGQDQVLESVVDTLRRSHLGLTDNRRPLASFLFLGPTGVGKTELAKTTASELFGSENKLIQVNMSEYMESHSVAKLIGSPPGYVGYQEGGQLTEKIRENPYSVVLFDEIEKAHPDILNLLLQILEEGELTDGRGRKASFRNTVVVLTSNIGAEEVAKDEKLGFDVKVEDEDSEMDKAFEEMRDDLLSSLRDEIRPEILNRLDDVMVFRGLNQEDCLEITQNLVNELVERLMGNKIMLKVDKAVVKKINEEGYSKEYGARNLRRKIQEVLENGLANFLLDNKVKIPKKGMLRIGVSKDKDGVKFTKLKK